MAKEVSSQSQGSGFKPQSTCSSDPTLKSSRRTGFYSVYFVGLLAYHNIYLYFTYRLTSAPHISILVKKSSLPLPTYANYAIYSMLKPPVLSGLGYVNLKLMRLCCKLGGRIDKKVYFRSHGPE